MQTIAEFNWTFVDEARLKIYYKSHQWAYEGLNCKCFVWQSSYNPLTYQLQ